MEDATVVSLSGLASALPAEAILSRQALEGDSQPLAPWMSHPRLKKDAHPYGASTANGPPCRQHNLHSFSWDCQAARRTHHPEASRHAVLSKWPLGRDVYPTAEDCRFTRNQSGTLLGVATIDAPGNDG